MTTKSKSGAIGIMGGTFDPIHFGHLLMAEEARQAFDLAEVIFVPNGRPAHKKEYFVTDPEDRFAMTQLATASNPHFTCSRVELDRPGPSFAIDTIRHFRSAYPDADELYFITGADAILQILTWKDFECVLSECRFIAATRPGFQLDQLQGVTGQALAARVSMLTIPGLDISSTDIRNRVRDGRSIKYLTPDPVEVFIHEHGLYRRNP